MLQGTIQNLDWGAAAVALAGIQVDCQRRRYITSGSTSTTTGTSEDMKREVTERLKEYWLGTLSRSISDMELIR